VSTSEEDTHGPDLSMPEGENWFRTVLDDMTEFVVRWRPDGTRTFVNRAYCEYFNSTFDELVGTSFLAGMKKRDRGFIDGVLEGLTKEQPVARSEGHFMRPSGGIAIQEWINRGVFDQQGRLVEIQSAGRDITEQRHAETAEREKTLLVEVLRDTASVLNSTLDLDEVFDRILANMGWVIPYNAAAIFFVEDNHARVVRLSGWEDKGITTVPSAVHLTESEIAALSEMMATGKPLVIQDTEQDSRWNPGDRRLFWVRSFAAAPLFDESKIFGVLTLFCDRSDYFTDVHLELLAGFASQAATASRNARLFETVSKSRRELRDLSARIVEAQEDERKRISQELHDGVAQTLTGALINIELLINEAAAGGQGEPSPRLEKVAVLAKQSLNQIRDLSHRLRPAMLDELGLVSTLNWFTRRFASWSGTDVEFNTGGMEDDRLDPSVETALYRVVQESLTSIGRQPGITNIDIDLNHLDNLVTLHIGYDVEESHGSPVDAPVEGRSEIEVLGIRERVVAIGGKLSWTDSDDGRLAIDIQVPDSPRHD